MKADQQQFEAQLDQHRGIWRQLEFAILRTLLDEIAAFESEA